MSSCCGSDKGVDDGAKKDTPVSDSAKAIPSGCCSAAQPKTGEIVDGGATGSEAVPQAAISGCCSSSVSSTESDDGGCCGSDDSNKIDWILWICTPLVVIGYLSFLIWGDIEHMEAMAAAETTMVMPWWETMMHTAYEMVNAMWWGIISASLFVGLLGRIPRELIMSLLGQGGSKRGIFRATLAGLMLDLCNHGILMVGMKLYERGASAGQVIAFLVASPWNSLTLTLILVGLIGLEWTMLFIVASMVIAWLTGWIFDRLVDRGTLPPNPHQAEFRKIPFWPTLKQTMTQYDWSLSSWLSLFWQGLKESKMVLRWVVFGVVLVALIRAFVPADSFGLWFGASVSGLFLTLAATTVIEVCSEGSSPIAADLFNRAGAPGNAFTFLMAGAATDYTEIMALKETTKSWKLALFVPLITVPQVLLIGWIMNGAPL